MRGDVNTVRRGRVDARPAVREHADESADRHTDFIDEGLHGEADTFGTLAGFPFKVFDGVADHCVGHNVVDALRNAEQHKTDCAENEFPVCVIADKVHGEHNDCAEYVYADISPFFGEFLGHPRNEN